MAELLDDALFGPDGTQALAPPPVLPDPLAGLVTGEMFTGAGVDKWSGGSDRTVVVPAAAPLPDGQQLRDAVAAMLAEDRPVTRRRPSAPPAPAAPRAYPPTRRPYEPPRRPSYPAVSQPAYGYSRTPAGVPAPYGSARVAPSQRQAQVPLRPAGSPRPGSSPRAAGSPRTVTPARPAGKRRGGGLIGLLIFVIIVIIAKFGGSIGDVLSKLLHH